MDAICVFKNAMLAAGMIPPSDIIADGKLHRYHIEGDRPGTRNGAYIFHLDRRPAGWCMDYKRGLSAKWKIGGGHWLIDEATRQQVEADHRKRQAEIEARHLKRAAEARVIWGKASPYTTHPYLSRKSVQAHGLRAGDWPKWLEGPDGWRRLVIEGALLVPMVDEAGTLWNLQAIFPEVHPDLGRDKDFMGGRKAGLFHAIGAPSTTLRIAEGYATGATVHEITGNRVFVAFDAGNLPAVARTVRKLHPESRIIIMADNDRHTTGNPGVTKAREAALAVGGFVAIPEFPEGSTGSDWNDWHQLERFPGSPGIRKMNISPLALPVLEGRHG